MPISIVIPAYNEESRLPATLRQVRAYLDQRGLAAEIIVVDDGSVDRTVEAARLQAAEDPRVRVISLGENRGKGAAVRTGMLAAQGQRALFMDADLATPMSELEKLEHALDQGADVAIGSRGLKDSQLIERQHPGREIMGRGFNLLVKAAGLPNIRDTQCGFKLFTREAAQTLFAEARIDRFAFDVELLFLARERFRVVEVPVAWRHVQESRVSPLRDAVRMAFDVARVRAQVWGRARTVSTAKRGARFIEVDGVRIHYRDEGSGPTLVLLHGVMASLDTWDGWVERLAQHYRILRIDLPGFGLSDDLPASHYTPEHSARFFDRVRSALGISRFHVAGNSLGGFLAWYYAAQYPEYVDRLILLNPIAYPQRLPDIIRLVSLPAIGEMAHLLAPRPLVARNVRMVYGDPQRVTPEIIDRYHHPLRRISNRRAMVRTFRLLRKHALDPTFGEHIGKIRAPTLLVWGELDRWVPVELVEHWRRDLPSVTVKVYPGLGHIPMEELPQRTAEDAHAFLSQVR